MKRTLLAIALLIGFALPGLAQTKVNGTTQVNPASGNIVYVSTSICNGSSDSRAALQAILTADAGQTIMLPDGATCLMTVATTGGSGLFLTLPAGTILKGHATLKVENSQAPYSQVLFGSSCTSCDLEDFTIDANIANNAITNQTEINTYPRDEIVLFSGANMTVRNVTIKNSSSVNSIDMNGTTVYNGLIEGNNFEAIGDDPNHVVHDASAIYVDAYNVSVVGNKINANAPASPGATTGIELHGCGISATGNVINGYAQGANLVAPTSGATCGDQVMNFVGNTIANADDGVEIWSSSVGDTEKVVVGHNSIGITQTAYNPTNFTLSSGIYFNPANTEPIADTTIDGNTISFQLEGSSRVHSVDDLCIGWVDGIGVGLNNISVTNNICDNSPISGIAFHTTTAIGLHIAGNIITNAGSSLDTGDSSQFYRIPIFIATSSGTIQGDVTDNEIIDNESTSRMTYPFALAGAAVTNDLRVIDNLVQLTGSTTTSFLDYFEMFDNNVKPLIRMIAMTKAWAGNASTMKAGSTVFDHTTALTYYLPADGTGWTTNFNAPTISANATVSAATYEMQGTPTVGRVTTDFTDSTSTTLTAITGLSWSLPTSSAINLSFHCALLFDQATAAVSDSFGIGITGTAPTQANAGGTVHTSTTVSTTGTLVGLASTTPTAVVTFTPSAITTVWKAELDGTIEQPSNATPGVFKVYVSTTTGGDNIIVKRGSYCSLVPVT